ncbi:MAG TPA: hypothetical protein VJL29_06035 [Thermoguttaceae bacterium]|nr:hypothetical protein [Thermoguttaceae bacterium]
MNRNQFFLLGVIALLLGTQFLLTYEFVVTPECTKFLAEKTGHPMFAAIDTADQFSLTGETVAPPKQIHPPEWLGWLFTSAGTVLVLHAMAMKKPG